MTNVVNVYILWYSVNASPWNRAWPFIWTFFAILLLTAPGKRCDPLFEQTWIVFTQENLVPKLDEICPVVEEKKIIRIWLMNFHYVVFFSAWKGAWPFIGTKLNPPSLKDALWQVWLKFVHWFWRKMWKEKELTGECICIVWRLKNRKIYSLDLISNTFRRNELCPGFSIPFKTDLHSVLNGLNRDVSAVKW